MTVAAANLPVGHGIGKLSGVVENGDLDGDLNNSRHQNCTVLATNFRMSILNGDDTHKSSL
jgi:hypothetical protein